MTWSRVVVVAKLMLGAVDKAATFEAKASITAKRKAYAEALGSRRGLALAYRALRAPPPKRLCFLKGPTGWVHHAGEVDRVAREAWSIVFEGNAGPALSEHASAT
eukprot:6133958-Alexandrium_andersonii.AAC.1